MLKNIMKLTAGLPAVSLPILGVALSAYAIGIEPRNIEYKEIQLKLPRLDPAFSGYKLIQLSDIHLDTWTGSDMLPAIVQRVNAYKPDAIVITGDYANKHLAECVPALVEALSQLKARDGVFAIPGNHDHWCSIAYYDSLIEQTHLIDLRNTLHTIERDGAKLHIAGIDDCLNSADDLGAVIVRLPDEGCAILLAHEPDFADIAASVGRFDLQLSGHTHGGQIVLPILGAPVLPPMGKKYISGMYWVEDMQLYTNRGLGTGLPPVRLNCPPEVSIFTLYPER
jgi:predicted MPP superfamily phosphohydrolase